MKSRVSEKGQFTIPKRVRDQLGIRKGEVLEVRVEKGRLVATKVVPRGRFEAVFGILRPSRSVDEIMRDLRGEADPA